MARASPDRRTSTSSSTTPRRCRELTYPAATLDKSKATLTVRARLDDPPVTVPERLGITSPPVRPFGLLPAGTPFQQSHVYEFTYTAKNPWWPRSAWRRRAISFPFCTVKDDAAGESARGRCAAHLQLLHLAALTHPERLPGAWASTRTKTAGASSTAYSAIPAAAAAIRSTIDSRRPEEPSATARTTCTRKACSRSPIRC